MNPQITNPFTREELNKIFVLSSKHPDRLATRENNCLEFKESFGFQSLGKYIRTAAGFANAKGGYIVYGIGNSPHTIVGLKDEALNNFNKLDPETLTEYFNEHFDPTIDWDKHLYEFNNKSLGLIYIYESTNKPVICKQSAGDAKNLKEGEIYYRYRGRTQTIRYAELKQLIDERREKEQRLWFKHLKEIARIGVMDAALLDLRKGIVTGSGGNLVIDESLLPQLAFIKEGQFNETKGKPTLKLIGSVDVTSSSLKRLDGKVRTVKTRGIHSTDIIQAFLNDDKISESKDYFTQIAWESSAFLPCYFYLKQAKLTIEDGITAINQEQSTAPTKSKLIERLNNDKALHLNMPSSNSANGRKKLAVRDELISKKTRNDLQETDLCDMLDMIRTLSKDDLPLSYLRDLLQKIVNRHFAKNNPKINDKIRRAICYIDYLHYREDTVICSHP